MDYNKDQLVAMIEHLQVSLDPQADEIIEHLEYLLLNAEERENAMIS